MIDKEKLIANWDDLEYETKTKILELADKENKEEYFVPKEGEVYYYYDFDRITIVSKQLCYCNNHMDAFNINTGNCFKTLKEAIFAGACDYYTKRFETYVKRRSKKLDWDNEKQLKYSVYYDCASSDIFYAANWTNTNLCVTYASSEQVLKDAIADIGEDNFEKYVMKVEEK